MNQTYAHSDFGQREQDKLEELREVCRKTGLKLTTQRQEILRELARAKDHPSAETLYQRVRERVSGVSLDTIYRTLSTFEKHELVDKLNVAQDQGRYDANRTPHHHLVCRICKGIEDFNWEHFDTEQLPEAVTAWGRVDSRHLVINGICRKCLEEQRDCGRAADDSRTALLRASRKRE